MNSDVTNPTNWSAGIPQLPFGDTIINGGSPNDPLWTIGGVSASPGVWDSTQSWSLNSLAIGTGAGTLGRLTIAAVADPSMGNAELSTAVGPALAVGTNGGTGIVDINLGTGVGTGVTLRAQSQETGSATPYSLSAGVGSGSNGTINVLGQGKPPSQSSIGTPVLSHEFGAFHARVGAEGGTGTVNVQEAGWVMAPFFNEADDDVPLLTIGTGTGSNGSVNVLAGGKLSINPYQAGALPTPMLIGAGGGVGTLTVSGTSNQLASGKGSSFNLGGGAMDIGAGAGSQGSLNVLAGGKALTYAHHQALLDPGTGDPLGSPPPVQIGVDGGAGQALVSGNGSIWYVGGAVQVGSDPQNPITDGTQIGHLHVGVSGPGALTIADGGVVTLGTAYIYTTCDESQCLTDLNQFVDGLGTLFLAETAAGSGSLNIGAAAGAAATAPGELRAAQIQFGPGTGTVVLNHTASDFTFAVPLAGTGTLANYSGTTWLRPASAPPAGAPVDNIGFAGTTQLYGGALGLGYDAALGSSAVQALGNAALLYESGVDITNGIDIAAGVTLQGSVASGGATQAGAITGAGALEKVGAGTLALTAANTYTGETRVTEGTLALTGAGGVSESSRVVANSIFDVSGAAAPASIRSLSGTGIVNLGGNGLNLTAANDTFAGSLIGSGAFTVMAGREILTGDSSAFAGPTFVNGGELWVNGSLGTAATSVQVNNSGTLGGSGVIGGSINVADGGTLVPGPELDVPGTLTVNGNASFAPAARMRYLFGQAGVPGGALNDLLNVGGNLVLDGFIDVVEAPGGQFDPGVYRVIDYAGSLTDNGLELGTVPASVGLSVQTSIANQVNLVLSPAGVVLSFWDGAAGPQGDGRVNGGDGTWQSSAGNSHWTNANGVPNAPFADASFAIFGGTPGTVTVDASLGAIRVAGMQFATSGYTVQGDPIEMVGPAAVVRVGTSTVGRREFLRAGNEHRATISAVLAGDAQLVKADSGTLVLSGQNTYTGGTLIRAGVVEVANDGNLGVTTGALDFGFGALRTTATMASSRAIGIATSATLLPRPDTTLTLDGIISGNGGLVKGDGGTLRLTGASPFAGPTQVATGMLVVDGNLGNSAVTVENSATLAGNGTIGSATLRAGGIAAPGSSIGTLTVNGSHVQQAGSVYQVEVDPASTRSDLINVGGGAVIETGAQLEVARTAPDPFSVGRRYTVLSAAGGVTGDYQTRGDVAVSPFLSLVDTYDANNVYLEVMQTRDLQDLACAANAEAAGGALQVTGGGLLDAILNVPDEASACDALGQSSGEAYASARTALIEDSRFLREAVGNRLRSASQGVAVDRMNSIDDGRGLWAHVFGSWGEFTAASRDIGDLDRDIGGFFLGADGDFGDAWRLGLLGGYSHSSFDVDRWRSSGSSDDYHLGIYAGRDWSDVTLQLGASYTWHDVSMQRRIEFAGFSDRLRGDFDASTTQAFAEVGYHFRSATLDLQPFLNAAYVHLNSDDVSESGGAAALTGRSDSADTTFATLGLRAAGPLRLDADQQWQVRTMVGWRHAFGDLRPTTAFSFGGGSPFVVTGVPIERDVAAFEFGLEGQWSNWRTGINYSGQLGRNSEDHGIRAYLSLQF